MAHRDPKLGHRGRRADGRRRHRCRQRPPTPAHAAPGSPQHRVPGRVRVGGHRPQRRGRRGQHPHPLRPRRAGTHSCETTTPGCRRFPTPDMLLPAADLPPLRTRTGPRRHANPRAATEEAAYRSVGNQLVFADSVFTRRSSGTARSNGRTTIRSVRRCGGLTRLLGASRTGLLGAVFMARCSGISRTVISFVGDTSPFSLARCSLTPARRTRLRRDMPTPALLPAAVR